MNHTAILAHSLTEGNWKLEGLIIYRKVECFKDMKSILLFLLLTISSLQANESPYSWQNQLGINGASLEEIKQLPGITEEEARAIYNWRETRGYFTSIYTLRKILPPEKFAKVKPLIRLDIPWKDREILRATEDFASSLEHYFPEDRKVIADVLKEKKGKIEQSIILMDAKEVSEAIDELKNKLKEKGLPVEDPRIISKLEEMGKKLTTIALAKDKEEVSTYIERLQDRLAAEESPAEGAIDEWEDLLLNPLNINRTSVDDLLLLDNVSIIDAVAVVKHIQTQGAIKDWRTLRRNVQGLSYYGYRNMQNFVTIEEPSLEKMEFQGNYRLKYDFDNRLDVGEDNIDVKISSLEAALKDFNFNPDNRNDTTFLSTRRRLKQTGWLDSEIDRLEAQLKEERETLKGAIANGRELHKLRSRLGERVKFGLSMERDAGERKRTDLLKGYIGFYDLGPLARFFLGNYRVTLGQGIVMDSGESGLGESPFRRIDRTVGLFGDLTSSEAFTLRGVALQGSLGRFQPLLFYSHDKRDAILNRDGTVNYYIHYTPRLEGERDKLSEKTLGTSLKLDLSQIGPIPLGTYVALNGYKSQYNPPFNPDPSTLDIPFDTDVLDDPNYTTLFKGKERRVYGTDFRTAIENVSLEGEWGRLLGGGKAYSLKGRIQYENLYLLLLRRRYDVDYDNPYSKGFMEQRKFDDTMLEREYRLLDPLYSILQEHPAPKAEEGTYLEMRYQLTRKLIITRAYVDTWKNLAYGLPNLRVQGEVEYRPVFPLRFRFKQKWQRKHLPKDVVPTISRTSESTFRIYAYISERDNLNLELRYGQVGLTPTVKYGSDVLMSGGYLSTSWEHNFSPRLSLRGGVAIWETNGMSQWIFEDIGIDFLEGRGVRYYFTVSDHLSPNLQIRFKFRNKASEFPHSGIYRPDEGYYYAGSPSTPVRDFTHLENFYTYSLQLDFRW